MKKELIISVDAYEVRTALLEEGVLAEFAIERKGERRIAGNIYKGKVKAILPGIQSAFVDIGLEKNGFLHVKDIATPSAIPEDVEECEGNGEIVSRRSRKDSISDILTNEQEILVQVIKEQLGTKGVKLSSFISIPGRFLVLMPTVDHIGVSRKIDDQNERYRLKEIAKKIRTENMGLIIRTGGVGKTEKEFYDEINYLVRLWRRIQKRAKISEALTVVYQEYNLIHRLVRDLLRPDIQTVLIDSSDEYNKLRQFVGGVLPEMKSRIKLYNEKQKLFDKYNLEKEIDKALRNKVRLKSGGWILIEQTEALVSIDVNTGKYVGKTSLDDTVLKTNLEAAVEIARQLRLKDMGGIIIIDFIDMKYEKHKHKLLQVFKDALKRDRAKTTVAQLSKLGLVEMTRQRVKQSVIDYLFQVCPYCKGNGNIKSLATTCIELQRRVEQLCATRSMQTIWVKIHPSISSHLTKHYRKTLTGLELTYNKKIILESDLSMHIEASEIDCL
ncbi:MAG: Rne/Rng family ribonuclease [bacterium]